jgi:O-acetyl-ADP-ribose deacetylase (regulator of RNase III)
MNTESQGVRIELVQGNIANQPDITAIVNAANAQLRRGGGVAGAIHQAAGPGLEKEAVSLGPIKPGQTVITSGHNLPNRYVIHCLGPVYGVNHPEAELLANCYRNALQLAERYEIDSIAFPAISTGIFGYPLEEATQVALDTIIKCIPGLQFIKKIRFVLYDGKTLEIHERLLKEVISN